MRHPSMSCPLSHQASEIASAPQVVGFSVFNLFNRVESYFQHTGSAAVVCVLSRPVACGILASPTSDRSHIPCIANWILNHWTTSGVPLYLFSSEEKG